MKRILTREFWSWKAFFVEAIAAWLLGVGVCFSPIPWTFSGKLISYGCAFVAIGISTYCIGE